MVSLVNYVSTSVKIERDCHFSVYLVFVFFFLKKKKKWPPLGKYGCESPHDARLLREKEAQSE